MVALPLATLCASARTQALLRPIAPGKVTTSFAPLGRVLFWELFLRAHKIGVRSLSAKIGMIRFRILAPSGGG